MKFKTPRQESEWNGGKIPAVLKQIVNDAASHALKNSNWEFAITSIFRTPQEDAALKASGIHTLWRAVDVRTNDQNPGNVDAMADYINGKWIYDPKRPNMKVCFTEPHGNDLHAHFQIHANTAPRPQPQPEPINLSVTSAASAGAATGFSERNRAAVNALVSCHETSRAVGDYSRVAVLNDDAGISYGSHQATHKALSLFKICKMYCDLSTSPTAPAARLVKFLGILSDPAKRHAAAKDETLKALLREAGKDPLMRFAQNRVFERNYLDPAIMACRGSKFVHALSLAVIYDSMIQGGYATCRDRTIASGEHNWITEYVAVRRRWLTNHSKPIVRKTVYRMETFEKLIAAGNWNLSPPFTAHDVKITETDFAFWMSGAEPGANLAVAKDPELETLNEINTELIAEETSEETENAESFEEIIEPETDSHGGELIAEEGAPDVSIAVEVNTNGTS